MDRFEREGEIKMKRQKTNELTIYQFIIHRFRWKNK